MAVVVHPDLEIETARARDLLGTTVPLSDAVRQWANMGALVDGLHRGDFAVISRALEDTIAEPRRASLVPGLAVIKRAAVEAGALGCSLSGSGPSLFALCEGAGSGRDGRGGDDRRGESPNRRRAADLRFADRSRGRTRAFHVRVMIMWGSAPHPGSVACGGPLPRAAPSQARRARLARARFSAAVGQWPCAS